AEVAWEVYEVHYGMARPTFFIFMPLLTLAQNDDILVWEQNMANQDGGTGLDRLKEIARDSYASSETTLYQVRPDMSHVSSEFADSDPLFWKRSSSSAVKPDKNLYVKPAKRGTSEKHAAGNPPPQPR
ncbi:MAG: hypothetical protein M3N22_10085, partial [Acidobacteriota bacterium]|nr:hypothetical protein [Acidobacteriota bacterium]